MQCFIFGFHNLVYRLSTMLGLVAIHICIATSNSTTYQFLQLKMDFVLLITPRYKLKLPKTRLKPLLCTSQARFVLRTERTVQTFLSDSFNKTTTRNGFCTLLGVQNFKSRTWGPEGSLGEAAAGQHCTGTDGSNGGRPHATTTLLLGCRVWGKVFMQPSL